MLLSHTPHNSSTKITLSIVHDVCRVMLLMLLVRSLFLYLFLSLSVCKIVKKCEYSENVNGLMDMQAMRFTITAIAGCQFKSNESCGFSIDQRMNKVNRTFNYKCTSERIVKKMCIKPEGECGIRIASIEYSIWCGWHRHRFNDQKHIWEKKLKYHTNVRCLYCAIEIISVQVNGLFFPPFKGQ